MGPTNVALVRLYRADQALRRAQERLDAATKDVRLQERRTNDLAEKLKSAQTSLRQNQSQSGQLDLDLKSRDVHIERLRTQQQAAKTNKEYQTFLVEINTLKLDKSKVEEETMTVMELVETQTGEVAALSTHLEGEQSKLASMRAEINDRIKGLQDEIDALAPARQAAADATPSQPRGEFERLADRYDGEVMSAIERPNKRREEYACTACNMDLVTDIYNRLHTRDDIVFCPSCRRMLYIPEDLPVEAAVNKVREKKAIVRKAPAASTNRQTSAVDVLNSMKVDPEDNATDAPAGSTDGQSAAASAPESTAPESSVPGDMTEPSTNDVPPQATADAANSSPQ